MDKLTEIWERATETKLTLEKLQELLGSEPSLLRELFILYAQRRALRDFHFAVEWEKASVWGLTKARLLPLTLTFFLSFGSVITYTLFHNVTKKYALYIAMAPLISNVGGNHGLITASSVMRGLATVSFNRLSVVVKEVLAGVVCGLILGAIGGIIALVGYKSVPMALTVICSLVCALATSGLFGTCAPIFFSWLRIDPARVAGPMETTIQDFVTYSSYFLFLQLFMRLFGE